ncbi:hypothetical protein KI387_002572, partial [Taxus chinensis]
AKTTAQPDQYGTGRFDRFRTELVTGSVSQTVPHPLWSNPCPAWPSTSGIAKRSVSEIPAVSIADTIQVELSHNSLALVGFNSMSCKRKCSTKISKIEDNKHQPRDLGVTELALS